MFGLEFRLHVDTFLKKYALKKGVLVSQHEALISCGAMSCIEVGQSLFLNADGLLQLLDVLCSSLSERSLRLSVPLLPLLCGRVDLLWISSWTLKNSI